MIVPVTNPTTYSFGQRSAEIVRIRSTCFSRRESRAIAQFIGTIKNINEIYKNLDTSTKLQTKDILLDHLTCEFQALIAELKQNTLTSTQQKKIDTLLSAEDFEESISNHIRHLLTHPTTPSPRVYGASPPVTVIAQPKNPELESRKQQITESIQKEASHTIEALTASIQASRDQHELSMTKAVTAATATHNISVTTLQAEYDADRANHAKAFAQQAISELEKTQQKATSVVKSSGIQASDQDAIPSD